MPWILRQTIRIIFTYKVMSSMTKRPETLLLTVKTGLPAELDETSVINVRKLSRKQITLKHTVATRPVAQGNV